MKPLRTAILPALAMTLVFAGQAQAEYPGRKSGLWEAVTTGTGIPNNKTRECVDQTTDKAALGKPQGAMAQDCKVGKVESSTKGFSTEVTCAMPGVQMVVNTTASGDFNTAVQYTVVSKFDPPFMGQTSRTLKIDATYKGACPEGLQPGDIETDGGLKYTKADQERMAQQAHEMAQKAAAAQPK